MELYRSVICHSRNVQSINLSQKVGLELSTGLLISLVFFLNYCSLICWCYSRTWCVTFLTNIWAVYFPIFFFFNSANVTLDSLCIKTDILSSFIQCVDPCYRITGLMFDLKSPLSPEFSFQNWQWELFLMCVSYIKLCRKLKKYAHDDQTFQMLTFFSTTFSFCTMTVKRLTFYLDFFVSAYFVKSCI